MSENSKKHLVISGWHKGWRVAPVCGPTILLPRVQETFAYAGDLDGPDETWDAVAYNLCRWVFGETEHYFWIPVNERPEDVDPIAALLSMVPDEKR